MPMVIDTSVTMAWYFEDETSTETESILDLLRHDHAVVPSLWQLEVTNVLLVAERIAAPLATLDARLATACPSAGVPLLIRS